jgi:SAM-dependent methyltransferase
MQKDGMGAELTERRGPSLGKPAEFGANIVQRRINLVRSIPGFVGKDKTLVDIGCGNGASMFLLAPEMASCLGIDVTESHLPAFERYRADRGITNCGFLKLDIEREPFDRTFDRLLSFEVIEHLRDEASVKFYYNVLNRGGLAAISVPNKWWLFETHGANLPLLPWNRVPFFSWLPRRIHETYARARIYTRERIGRLLVSAGFEILHMQYVTAPLDVLSAGPMKSFLTGTVFRNDTTAIPFLSTAIFVAARKR